MQTAQLEPSPSADPPLIVTDRFKLALPKSPKIEDFLGPGKISSATPHLSEFYPFIRTDPGTFSVKAVNVGAPEQKDEFPNVLRSYYQKMQWGMPTCGFLLALCAKFPDLRFDRPLIALGNTRMQKYPDEEAACVVWNGTAKTIEIMNVNQLAGVEHYQLVEHHTS